MTIVDENQELAPQQRSEAAQLLLDKESDIEPTLSIVMPTLNEEDGIKECIQKAKSAIEELGLTAEIILSDSSTDRTPAIGRALGALVYEPDQPGYGYAYQYAFSQARGEYIIMGDADTTYDFEQIPRLLDQLQEENADIAIGSRLDGEIKPGAMPLLHRYVGNPLLTKFLNVFYSAGVSDAHSGFRIFTRDALEKMELQTTGMEFASEMIMEASSKDLDIVEKPIVYHERKGEETLDSFRDGWRHVRFMLKNAPGYLFSVPGVLFATVGILLIGMASTGVTVGSVTPGIHTMIAGTLLVIVGYQLLYFGPFSAVVGEPIRKPENPISKQINEKLTLERGIATGFLLVGAGALYAGQLVYRWRMNGFTTEQFTIEALAAFTAIVIGIQTVFSAFLMDLIKE